MSAKPVPPQPPPPDFNEKPRSSAWTIVLAGVGLMFAIVALTFLTLGYFSLVVMIGAGVFMLIGAQYLIWGWLLERIYRNGRENLEE
ncbi:hypothetical protein [Anatilimnocola floriformis]|uniref:hypothetical protein n=1 Tax=Anatilimnocola floriformis TaxID=2948575 RepID=UPI0020C46356|nr:hypothetical protein [Anatilimnocola floriformis]